MGQTMRITKVEVLKPEFVMGPFKRALSGCRVYTDEGIYGDGQTSLSTGVGTEAGAALIERMAGFLIGMDPMHTEAIWDSLFRLQASFWGQNGGPIVYGAMSALDIALWDIKGKFFNTPIYNLLGGKKRTKMRAYASQPQFGWGDIRKLAEKPEEYATYTKMAIDAGYDSTKLDFLWGTPEYKLKGLLPAWYWRETEAKVKAVRDAIGYDVDLIVESHGMTDVQSVLQYSKMLEKYNIFYLEEPTVPDAKLTKYIAERTSIPIAAGERIQTRWQYRPYFEMQALSIIQPDVGTCGGISEAKKICDMANTYDIGVQMHNLNTPLTNAANLHIETSISNFVIHEDTSRMKIMTLDNGAPLCTESFMVKDGFIVAPDGPGLGTEWSKETMETSVCATVTEPEPSSHGLVNSMDASLFDNN